MVLQEVQHIMLDAFKRLPAAGEIACRSLAAHNGPYRIVEPDLIIQIIKMPVPDIITIFSRIIHFGNKTNI